MQFQRFEKLQKYYLNTPVDPAIYKQGDSLGLIDAISLEECENGGGGEPTTQYYYRYALDDICDGCNLYRYFTLEYSTDANNYISTDRVYRFLIGESGECCQISPDCDYFELRQTIHPYNVEDYYLTGTTTGLTFCGFDLDRKAVMARVSARPSPNDTTRTTVYGFAENNTYVGGKNIYNNGNTGFTVVQNGKINVLVENSFFIRTLNSNDLKSFSIYNTIVSYMDNNNINHPYYLASHNKVMCSPNNETFIVYGKIYNKKGNSLVSYIINYFFAVFSTSTNSIIDFKLVTPNYVGPYNDVSYSLFNNYPPVNFHNRIMTCIERIYTEGEEHNKYVIKMYNIDTLNIVGEKTILVDNRYNSILIAFNIPPLMIDKNYIIYRCYEKDPSGYSTGLERVILHDLDTGKEEVIDAENNFDYDEFICELNVKRKYKRYEYLYGILYDMQNQS